MKQFLGHVRGLAKRKDLSALVEYCNYTKDFQLDLSTNLTTKTYDPQMDIDLDALALKDAHFPVELQEKFPVDVDKDGFCLYHSAATALFGTTGPEEDKDKYTREMQVKAVYGLVLNAEKIEYNLKLTGHYEQGLLFKEIINTTTAIEDASLYSVLGLAYGCGVKVQLHCPKENGPNDMQYKMFGGTFPSIENADIPTDTVIHVSTINEGRSILL